MGTTWVWELCPLMGPICIRFHDAWSGIHSTLMAMESRRLTCGASLWGLSKEHREINIMIGGGNGTIMGYPGSPNSVRYIDLICHTYALCSCRKDNAHSARACREAAESPPDSAQPASSTSGVHRSIKKTRPPSARIEAERCGVTTLNPLSQQVSTLEKKGDESSSRAVGRGRGGPYHLPRGTRPCQGRRGVRADERLRAAHGVPRGAVHVPASLGPDRTTRVQDVDRGG